MHLQQSGSSALGYRSESTTDRPCATNAADKDNAATNLASASKVVLGCVCSALGQPRQTASVQALATALGAELAAAVALDDELAPAHLTQTVECALDRATQQLTSRGVSSDHALKLVDKLRQELLHAFSEVAHAAATAATRDSGVSL